MCEENKKKSSYDSVKLWRSNTRLKLFEAFGGRCGQCGIVDDPIIYDIHHLDPATKRFPVGQQIQSWANIVEEASGCAMLCSHCHRKHHAGLIVLRSDLPRFDESLIRYEDKSKPCPVCQKPIPLGRITCSSSCASQYKYRVPWDDLDLEALLLEHRNAYRLGQFLGVSDVSVRKQLRKRNIGV